MTHTIAVSPDVYKQLREYTQMMGKTVDEIVYEALGDFIEESVANRLISQNNRGGQGKPLPRFSEGVQTFGISSAVRKTDMLAGISGHGPVT